MKDVKGWEVSLRKGQGIRMGTDGIFQAGKSVYHDSRYAPADKIIVL